MWVTLISLWAFSSSNTRNSTKNSVEVYWQSQKGLEKLSDIILDKESAVKWHQIDARSPASQSNDGNRERVQGPILAEVIESTISHLSDEERSTIDLIHLSGESGEADIPRAFLNRAKVIIVKGTEGLRVVMESPTPKKQDFLPLEKYWVTRLKKIVLTNYQLRYPARFFVTDRHNPMLLRGERRFVQVCVGCHLPIQDSGAFLTNVGKLKTHPNNPVVSQLEARDLIALKAYFSYLGLGNEFFARQ